MQVSCEGKDRQLRMDILDRDLFDPKPNIPQHTSWTMSVLHELDQAIGPGVLDKPIFAMDNDPHAGTAPNSVTIQALREGEYNNLFSRGSSVSEVVHEADLPPESLPSVELTSASPFMPLSPELPKYPPIARAARLEGSVNLTFDVDSLGKVQYIEVTSGTQQRMLQGAAEAAAKTWTFPEAAFGKKIQATLGFKLNCQFTVDTNVN
jgi:TonB family protein